MTQLSDDDESVRHLAELGYFDPDEVAAEEARARAARRAEYLDALERCKQGHGEEAVTLLSAILEKDPAWITPRRAIVEICHQNGWFEAARTGLDWLTCHGVESPRLSLIAGSIALARRDLSTAIDHLTYAAAVEPLLPNVHELLGAALLRRGMLDEATGAFQAALRIDQGNPRALNGMATVSIRRRDYESGADWALQALERDLRLFEAHVNLGVALFHLDRLTEGVHALETAAKADRKRAAPYFWLRRLAEHRLRDESAADEYRRRGREAVRLRRQEQGSPRASSLNAE